MDLQQVMNRISLKLIKVGPSGLIINTDYVRLNTDILITI